MSNLPNKKIMIYAEVSGGEIESSCYELLTKARETFKEDETEIALAAICSGQDEIREQLAGSGADQIFLMEDERFRLFNIDYYAGALVRIQEAFDADVILIPASSTGEELAPTLGKKLDTGVAAHCVDICLDEEGQLVQLVPAFGGKVIGEILTPDTRPQIASIKPGMFTADERLLQSRSEASIVDMDTSWLEEIHSKITAKAVRREAQQGMPLEKAPVIVCGGFGVGSQENWDKIEELAVLLGGAAGCTRPVIDQGWAKDEQKMIGTSGKSVRPKVYIGTGISGAAHHVCGMQDSGVVISINRDEDSEMFAASDYIVCADGAKMIDALIEKLRR